VTIPKPPLIGGLKADDGSKERCGSDIFGLAQPYSLFVRKQLPFCPLSKDHRQGFSAFNSPVHAFGMPTLARLSLFPKEMRVPIVWLDGLDGFSPPLIVALFSCRVPGCFFFPLSGLLFFSPQG